MKYALFFTISFCIVTTTYASHISSKQRAIITELIQSKRKLLQQTESQVDEMYRSNKIARLLQKTDHYDEKIESWLAQQKQFSNRPDIVAIIDRHLQSLRSERCQAIASHRSLPYASNPSRLEKKIQKNKNLVEKKDALRLESKRLTTLISNLDALQKSRPAAKKTKPAPSVFVPSLFPIPEYKKAI